MFKNEKIFVCDDVGSNRDALCKKLVDNGAVLASQAGEQNTICLFNSFGGSLFEDCCKKGFRVIGVQCVNDSLKDKKTLPRAPHPVYSRTLEGVVVCGADITEDKVKLKTLVGYMNGTWVDEVTAHTNAFLAVEPGAQQYWASLEYGISVVKPSWIYECWDQQTQVNLRPHLLPIFSGCVISVTGLSMSTRTTFQKMITAAGGKYSEQLTRSCTHLVADKPKGRKYAVANTWGVHIVTTNWLLDSINLKGCADVTKYELATMAPEFDDAVYIKPGSGGSRFGSHYTHSPGARRSMLSPYSPLLVRRNRYSGSSASSVPPMYPPPFSSSSLPSPAPAVPLRFSLPPPIYTTQTFSSRNNSNNFNNIPNTNSTNNNTNSSSTQRTINSYFDKVKLEQLMSFDVSATTVPTGMTLGSTAYREMYTELTDLLEMCDIIIGKFSAEQTHAANNNTSTSTSAMAHTTSNDHTRNSTQPTTNAAPDTTTSSDDSNIATTTTTTTTTADINMPDESDDEATQGSNAATNNATNNNNNATSNTTAHTSSEEK